MLLICRSLRVMLWWHRGFTWKPRSSLTKEKTPMKLASVFCIPEPLPVHTGIKGRQVHPLIRFLLRSREEWEETEKRLLKTGWEECWSPQSHSSLFCSWCGVTVRSVESLSLAIPLDTSTKRANSKRANHGRSRLFQDAVSSVSFWLRSFPVCGWQTWLLSSVSGLPTRWRCVRGWLMCLLWAYEPDFIVISPFLSERIGTLCCHPCWALWLEQRIAGWHSGRSEGDSKSLSTRYVPTDLLLLTQRTGSQVISLVRPTGRPAFHSERHL